MPDLFEASYSFDLASQERSIIKVIGVGGGGSNAVTFMYNQGIKDVEFVVVNTDAQALRYCAVPTRLQIGTTLTEGLGAGANPEKGRDAAIESEESIKELLSDGTKMVFVTAGMGGGTGTGAAPVIAKIAKSMGILTVGIVTAPFRWEGPKKRKQAEEGIEELKRNCDTVLVILNDKVREMFGDLRITEAFGEADNILATGARSIAEIITVPGVVNVDFEDVKTVMKSAGSAVMGSAQVKGDNRALKAAEEALASPLLNNRDITGAERILISLSSSQEHETSMDELDEILEYIQAAAGHNANIIYGHSIDNTLGEYQRVTVIATSFMSRAADDDVPFERPQVIELDRSQATMPIDLSVEPKAISLTQTVDIPPQPAVEVPAPRQPVQFAQPQPSVAQPVYGHTRLTVEPQPQARPVAEAEPMMPLPAPMPLPQQPAMPVYGAPAQQQTPIKVAPMRPGFQQNQEADFQRKRQALLEASEERRRRFSNQVGNITQNYAALEGAPAYARMGLQFDEQPAVASATELSRFTLSEDQELSTHNKFLHDNVD